MYQPLIPAIYHEVKGKSMGKLNTIVGMGTLVASIAYIICGIYGYATFSMNADVEEKMKAQNILDNYRKNVTIGKICLIGVLFVVTFASPFCILPSKDSLEQLLLPPNTKFT